MRWRLLQQSPEPEFPRLLSYLIEDLLKSRSLLALLDAYEPSPMPVSIIYPGQRPVPLKLRAFLDFASPRLRERTAGELVNAVTP